MRLYEEEKQALDFALKGVDSEVYIFGSRAYDNKKGGDIDLLIYSNQNSYKLSQEITINYKMQIDASLDVLVIDNNNVTSSQKAL